MLKLGTPNPKVVEERRQVLQVFMRAGGVSSIQSLKERRDGKVSYHTVQDLFHAGALSRYLVGHKWIYSVTEEGRAYGG